MLFLNKILKEKKNISESVKLGILLYLPPFHDCRSTRVSSTASSVTPRQMRYLWTARPSPTSSKSRATPHTWPANGTWDSTRRSSCHTTEGSIPTMVSKGKERSKGPLLGKHLNHLTFVNHTVFCMRPILGGLLLSKSNLNTSY